MFLLRECVDSGFSVILPVVRLAATIAQIRAGRTPTMPAHDGQAFVKICPKVILTGICPACSRILARCDTALPAEDTIARTHSIFLIRFCVAALRRGRCVFSGALQAPGSVRLVALTLSRAIWVPKIVSVVGPGVSNLLRRISFRNGRRQKSTQAKGIRRACPAVLRLRADAARHRTTALVRPSTCCPGLSYACSPHRPSPP